MLLLEMTAELGDEEAFLDAAAVLDWGQQTAADIAYAVRLALQAGAHLAARHLSARGTQMYPNDPELRRMASVLSPPRVLPRHTGDEEALRLNRAWLAAHGPHFRSQWVALCRGQLLAAAPSLGELRQLLASVGCKVSSAMLISQVD